LSADVIKLQIVEPESHWLNRLATWLYLRWLKWRIDHMAPVDVNMKCPACGHRDGDIRFIAELQFKDSTEGGIAHHCKICDANWVEKPIIRAKDWALTLPKRDE
jgi:hypothetical protein